MANVGGEAGDGDGTVDGHLVLLTVLCYVEHIWRELRIKEMESMRFSLRNETKLGF